MTAFQKWIIGILVTVSLCIMASAVIFVGQYVINSTNTMAARQITQNSQVQITSVAPSVFPTPIPIPTKATILLPTQPQNIPSVPIIQPTLSQTAVIPEINSPILPLDFSAIDAEYSSTLNRIIMVSEKPNQLHIYDPVAKKDKTVVLEFSPTSVSVSPDGLFAAVGHDAKISYVDLSQSKVIKKLDVSIPVFDVVLDGKGWVYATPKTQEEFHSIEISTNTDNKTRLFSLYHHAKIKLHPNGQSLYWANKGISPDDIGRIEISQGLPGLNYDSQYHGDYKMCSNFWFSNDGESIVTACGNTFKLNAERQNDIIYNGHIEGIRQIKSALQISTKNKLMILESKVDVDFSNEAAGDQIILYNFETHQKSGAVGLPKFVKDNIGHRANGRFLFVNKEETQYFIIVQANETSGLLHDYGLVTGSIDSLIENVEQTNIKSPSNKSHVFSGSIFALENNIIDAEYSNPIDRIILVTENPPLLHIYDPEKKDDFSVPLSFSPSSVSLSSDGNFAAVGHDSKISLVDIVNKKVTKILDIPIIVYDIVLAGNGWIYATPRHDQWVSIWGVEIQSGTAVKNQGSMIYNECAIKLHPDGLSLYGTTDAASPQFLPKFDISQGAPKYIMGSLNNSANLHYGTCGNLWISEDGLRVFSACGQVFRISSEIEQDEKYNGSLGQVTRVKYLDHSKTSGKIIVIPTVKTIGLPNEKNIDNQVLVFEYDNLTLENTIDIPDFNIDGQNVSSHGKFIFFNSTGNKFYVIVEADNKSSLKNVYGLFTRDN